MNIGDVVTVQAAATGDGKEHAGWIVDIYEFLHETFAEVKFFESTADGRTGITVSNPELIRPE